MAGAAGVGAGLGIMGGTLGGIGDIMNAANYQRPDLQDPGGQESRLRTLANSQMIGGGQQLLAGQALYNQMAPILLGQLPGMTMRPTGGGAAGGAGGAGGAPGMASYNEALANYQQAVGRQQQLTALKAQMKGAKKGPEKKATRQELKALKQTIKGSPKPPQLERQLYQAGSSSPPITMSAGTETAPAGGMTGGGSPSLQSSLAQILGYLHSGQESGGASPDFAGRYKAGFDAAAPTSRF